MTEEQTVCPRGNTHHDLITGGSDDCQTGWILTFLSVRTAQRNNNGLVDKREGEHIVGKMFHTMHQNTVRTYYISTVLTEILQISEESAGNSFPYYDLSIRPNEDDRNISAERLHEYEPRVTP